jgi:hypothetical protein
MSQMVPRARVERASLRLQRSAVTGSAVEGCGTPCRLRSDLAGVKIRRPPRSRTGQGSRRRDSNSTCDATSVGCSQNAPAILRDERRAAARAGFEPAVGRLTAACVSASPPGNTSRRAQPRRAMRGAGTSFRVVKEPCAQICARTGAFDAMTRVAVPRVVSSRVELDPSA